MKFEIFTFDSVASTNDEAINLIKKKSKKVGCVFAEKQTKGRGSHGRKWISLEGNLFGTIFFPLNKNFPPFNEFSLINPVIISAVIKNFCKKKDITIKWPNDIFLNGKKICGILQEVIILNEKKFLIIGVGLNISSNPNITNNYEATNILIETKKKPAIKEVINQIIFSYEEFFMNLKSYNYANFKRKAESIILN